MAKKVENDDDEASFGRATTKTTTYEIRFGDEGILTGPLPLLHPKCGWTEREKETRGRTDR